MSRDDETPTQMPLPGAIQLEAGGTVIPLRNNRIPHKEILQAFQNAAEGPGVVEIYRGRVLSAKTRTIKLLGRKSTAHIHHTLLGYEVKASFKRIQCPDLVTARYLKLFTELGCRSIKLPYDPTVTAAILPDLEQSILSVKNGVIELFQHREDVRRYVLERIYRLIRRQLETA